MRIIQILPVMAFGDAIGNDTITLDDTLKQSGYKSEVYAKFIDERLTERVKPLDKYIPEKEDIVI